MMITVENFALQRGKVVSGAVLEVVLKDAKGNLVAAKTIKGKSNQPFSFTLGEEK